ncbi:hypothetical protein ACFQ0M_01015 [Kitasatospora aburaviensis]
MVADRPARHPPWRPAMGPPAPGRLLARPDQRHPTPRPLATAGDHQAFAALERWWELEKARHDQLVAGTNSWPPYLGGTPWHTTGRNTANKVINAALADFATNDNTLIDMALRHKIPPAAMPWLAAVAKAAADRPDRADSSHDGSPHPLRRRPGPVVLRPLGQDPALPRHQRQERGTAAVGDLVRLGAAHARPWRGRRNSPRASA